MGILKDVIPDHHSDELLLADPAAKRLIDTPQPPVLAPQEPGLSDDELEELAAEAVASLIDDDEPVEEGVSGVCSDDDHCGVPEDDAPVGEDV